MDRIVSYLNFGGNIRPRTPEEIFRFAIVGSNNQIKIDVKPIIFQVPERAPKIAKLYVCVKGRIVFCCPFDEDKPKTDSFSTSVGYFRQHNKCLEHVYGVRYDFDINQFGHPAFHAQMDSLMCFSDHIRKRYFDDRCVSDKVEAALKHVRIPTAEMDVFSVFVQIIADHLIHRDSNCCEKKNLTRHLKTVVFFMVLRNQ